METIYCPQCRESLQLPKELLGQSVKCPACEHVFVGDTATRIAEGPPPESVGGEEQAEATAYSRRRQRRRFDYDDDYDDIRLRASKPHRGSAVLTLGILSLVICGPILGPIAWTMGHSDLKEMNAGYMDRSGEGITRAGMICGIVATALFAVGICLWMALVATVR